MFLTMNAHVRSALTCLGVTNVLSPRDPLVALLVLLTMLSCGRQASTLAQAKKENHEGLFPVKVSGKYGYIDKTGKLVINPQFDAAWGFAEGLALVGIGERDTTTFTLGLKAGGKYGFIDKTGKYVINPQFDAGCGFSEGLARVRLGDLRTGKWGYVDKTGKYIWLPSE